MIDPSAPAFAGEEEATPSPPRSRWMALLWGLLWRETCVVLLPVVLPSQAQIGSAQGDAYKVMVGVVAGLVGAALLGLLLGFWRSGGLVGSGYRVVAAAVAVRLAFLGPMPLIVTVWIAAVAVAVADWLLVAASRRTARRAVVVAQPDFEPGFEPAFVPGPPGPRFAAPAHPTRSQLRPGRPVVPWIVAVVGILAIAAIAWVSHAGLPSTSGPVSIVPTPGTTSGWTVCGRVRHAGICVQWPITNPVIRRVSG